ncbi:Lrp/AsnC family transcriptional regulator [Terribacillus halophilus]|jgi:Lrp/AsnC family transcriptional regulator, leucine-responsive regulatory protein|uniref:Lrp/AsnC family transcriptional regulator n=1 Tax=Terribacillus halophilus TaxID=361279 RepID=UPI000984BF8E|nr:Lrp/AsnC family transcriptional regulator [Terribacillus halophilus]
MLDATDQQIVGELTKNSRITMKELGEKVHLSAPAAAARIAKLEDNQIIEGYSIRINQDKLGYPLHTFLTIFTKNTSHQPYLAFIKTKQLFVVNNYKISGQGCYLLECRFPSQADLNQFLNELNNYVNYNLSIVIDK